MNYGFIIKKIRNSYNMTLTQFADKVGISKSHIQRLENEYSNKGKEKLEPPIDKLKQICDRTGYPFRKFLEEAGYIEPIENNSPINNIEELKLELEKYMQERNLSSIPKEQVDTVLLELRNLLKNTDK